MAKIVFLDNIWYMKFGIMYLSSCLKKAHHNTTLLLYENKKKLLKEIVQFSPDIVAFSLTTGSQKWALEVAKEIKALKGTVVIAGGPHATFYPEFINEQPIDAICRGEGENAIVRFISYFENHLSPREVENFWIKKGEEIIKNDLSRLIEDLDTIPFPDRKIYEKYKIFKNKKTQLFRVSRGCPFKCSFCFNHVALRLYSKKGKFVRRRNPEAVIEEIKTVISQSKPKYIFFNDDDFTLNKDWVLEFLPLFKKQINIPFFCGGRADELDENIVKELKKAGCIRVLIGLETGDEDLRINILKKNIPNICYLNSARLLKKYGIQMYVSNMFNIPNENLNSALKTVNLNIAMKTLPHSAIFQPYPGTDLAHYALKLGLTSEKNIQKIGPMSIWKTVLFQEETQKVINIQKLFFYAVVFPVLTPLIKILIHLKSNFLLDLLYFIGYSIESFISIGASFKEALCFAFKMKSVYWER